MKNSFIYVWTGDESYDLSRWLHIDSTKGDFYDLCLADLCHPGKLSEMSAVQVPKLVLKSLMAYGPIQMTTQEGYCLIRRDGELVSIEFKGRRDRQASKVAVRAADITKRLLAIEAELPQAENQSSYSAR